MVKPYNRVAAVLYAHRWAYDRNPMFYDYEYVGGDCTNFASQCVYAGSNVMNFTKTFGWYYRNANDKAPAWTGVQYFYNFMTRQTIDENAIGPFGRECELSELMPGDLVQLSFDGNAFQHTPIVVVANKPQTTDEVLVAAHSFNADYKPLSTYDYQNYRYIHIEGVRMG